MRSGFSDGAVITAMRINAGLTIEQLARAVDYPCWLLKMCENKHGLLHGPMPRKIRRHLEGIRAHEVFRSVVVGGPIRGRVKVIKRTIDEDFPCGARTRAGTPCRLNAVYGNGRCKLHGGCSTGPKTEAGKDRIRKAQHLRRARERSLMISNEVGQNIRAKDQS